MTAAAEPDVSVSIVNTSNRELLLACLESLEADTARRSTVDVWLVDNASDDGSAEAVRERFPHVEVIAQRHRAGFGANHNTAIRASTGRYVFVLNEDATVHPGSLDVLVDYMESHPDVGAVGPRIVFPDGRKHHSAWRFPTPPVCALAALTVAQAGWVQSGGSAPKRVDWATGCALLVRREALDAVGVFDEQFFIYAEELDLCRRLAAAGWQTHYVPGATVVHHRRQSSSGVSERRIVEHGRSLARYWRKYHRPRGARAAALFTGWQYAAASVAARVLLRLPERLRPVVVRPTDPEEYALYARNFWSGSTGPGLRESAEAWNAAHASIPR